MPESTTRIFRPWMPADDTDMTRLRLIQEGDAVMLVAVDADGNSIAGGAIARVDSRGMALFAGITLPGIPTADSRIAIRHA